MVRMVERDPLLNTLTTKSLLSLQMAKICKINYGKRVKLLGILGWEVEVQNN